MSISMRSTLKPSSNDSSSRSGSGGEEARAVDEVHADDAERLLLQRVLEVEHAHVHDDLAALACAAQLGT